MIYCIIQICHFCQHIMNSSNHNNAKIITTGTRGKNIYGWDFTSILEFMHYLKERLHRKEITSGTIRNYQITRSDSQNFRFVLSV